jgi:putative tricarboxylic transport membrane protein
MILEALLQLLTPEMLLLVFLSVLFGFTIGAIPGLGPVVGMVLLFPLTIPMDPLPAVVMLAAVYPAGVYGGSVTAVLVNTPGDPSSIVTTFDGYPMMKNGDGLLALGTTLTASVCGGLLSTLILLVLAPPFASHALHIGPATIFAVGLFGIVILVVVSRGSMLKGLVAASFGLLLAIVGFSPHTGTERFTFGSEYLAGGIPIVTLVIGLFAISEAMMLLYQGGTIEENPQQSTAERYRGKLTEMNQGVRSTLERPVSVIRSSSIGIGIGIVPGAGAIVANFVSYFVGKSFTSEGEKFGTGAVEGLISAESSNNAATSATLIPTLVLAVPGGIAAAILLGVLQLKNVRVGPQLFVETPELAYGIVLSLIIANVFMLLVGYFLSPVIHKVAKIDVEIIVPAIVVLSLLGGFAYNFDSMDVLAVLLFGIVGFTMRKLGFSPVAVVFGFILGPILENYYLNAVQLEGGDAFAVFLSPIPIVIILLSTIVLASQLLNEVRTIGDRLNI